MEQDPYQAPDVIEDDPYGPGLDAEVSGRMLAALGRAATWAMVLGGLAALCGGSWVAMSGITLLVSLFGVASGDDGAGAALMFAVASLAVIALVLIPALSLLRFGLRVRRARQQRDAGALELGFEDLARFLRTTGFALVLVFLLYVGAMVLAMAVGFGTGWGD